MTSKLSDAEVAAQLRAMGLDIGPVNAWTRGVYRRKLERLLLEQSILSSPEKYPQQTKTRFKITTAPPDLAVITSAAAAAAVERGKEEEEEGMEDDPGLDDFPEGYLRLEEVEEDEDEDENDGSEEDYMDDDLIGGCGVDRNGIGVNPGRPSRDESGGGGGGGGGTQGKGLQNSGDIHAAKKNLFANNANHPRPSTFNTEMRATKGAKATTHAKKVLHDDGVGKKEKASDLCVHDGSFPPPPLPKSCDSKINKNNNKSKGSDAAMNQHLRQRTALPRHQDTTNDVGSFERVALKPEDCVPSPRNPLSTYLGRCTPPPPSSSTFHPTDHHPSAGRLQQTKPEETGMWLWIGLAAVVALCILVILVLYNMEPGYASPI